MTRFEARREPCSCEQARRPVILERFYCFGSLLLGVGPHGTPHEVDLSVAGVW